MSGKTKTGLFFGSFNPIHNGHLMIAGYMVEFTDIAQAWFVVSPHNPLKEKSTLLADHHRLAMANIAVEDDPLAPKRLPNAPVGRRVLSTASCAACVISPRSKVPAP